VTLHRLDSHAELLDATRGDPFIRFDLPDPLEHPAWSLDDAVAVPRRTHTRRLGLLVMGPAGDAGRLVGRLLAAGSLSELGSVTVSRGSLDAVAEHLPLGEGNEWEWLYAASPPPRVAAETRMLALSERDRDDIRTLLAEANPGTDARPFEFPDQVWVGARDAAGLLVACGVREPNLAGWPILSGITVHPTQRGTGLGLAVTAYLTREAVRETGVCTLGLYSHNDVARRVYHGLGYTGDHHWSSRRTQPR
jgi:GNAT superfamily N-acetyltransferase